MNLNENLNKLLDKVTDEALKVPAIKRLIKSSRKQFRPKSPNDVDRLTYLASLLFVVGDKESSHLILEFVDSYAEEKNARMDSLYSLAMARLVWAYQLRLNGKKDAVKKLLAMPELDASGDLENLVADDLEVEFNELPKSVKSRFKFGESWIQDFLLETDLHVMFEETCEENPKGHKLKTCYDAFLGVVTVRERHAEVADKVSKADLKLLDEEIKFYIQKIADYL